MTKYKIKGTNILHSGNIYADGSEIELEDKDAEQIRNYLIPIREKKVNNNNNNTTKTTTNTNKTTSKTTPKEPEKQVTETKGGEE